MLLKNRAARTTQKSPRGSPKPDESERKPAIIGSQTTAVQIQLASRPAPKILVDIKDSSRSASQASAKSRKSRQGSVK